MGTSRPRVPLLSRIHRHQYGVHLGFNLAPMIDVTFLLLTFFMLASHFAAVERVEVKLPRPDDNQAERPQIQEEIIVNLQYQGPDAAPLLSLGSTAIPSVDRLRDELTDAAQGNPAVKVVLRADRRLAYGQVHQAMQAVTDSGLVHLQIVTELP